MRPYYRSRAVGRQSFKRRRIVRTAVFILCFSFFFALIHVWTRVLVVQTAYRIRTLMEEQEKLRGEYHTAKLEVASLKSPVRLEQVAFNIGLKAPAEKKVMLISARNR